MDQKIKLCDLPVSNDLRGLYSINVDADNNPTKTPWSFIQDAVDKELRALRAVIDNCRMPYVPSINIDNKNMLHKAYPRLVFQRNNLESLGGIFYDIDLLSGHQYTLSVQGCVSPVGIGKNRYLRVRIWDYNVSDDDEVRVCEDIPLRSPNIMVIGHSFICPKDSHYRITIDYCENNGAIVSDYTPDDYAYIEYIKLEEGAYVTCYADAADEDLNQVNLLPDNLEQFSHKIGTLSNRNCDGHFIQFLEAKNGNLPGAQFLSWVGPMPVIHQERSYTLSFSVRGIGAIRCGVYITPNNDSQGQHNLACVDELGQIYLPRENGSYVDMTLPLTDLFTKHYYTFCMDSAFEGDCQLAVLFEFVNASDEVAIRQVKLECGGRYTPFVQVNS